jgi:DNA-binding NarL/FixJ family response regulator
VALNDQIRVLSVDDHFLMRDAIAMIINSQPNMQMVAQASNGREAIERFREHRPDVTLMDCRLPDMSGIEAAVAIRTEFPEARIIILTAFDSDTDQQCALAAGASAFVLKSAPPAKLLETIYQVHAG